MSKQFWKAISLTVAAILTSLFLVIGQALLASATTQEPQIIAQVPSVKVFDDVKEKDYYYKSMKRLVEDYGCTAGYTDKTFRGDRSLQSAEFVGILNSCIDRMGEFVAGATADRPTTESLDVEQKLLKEIATEVNAMRR